MRLVQVFEASNGIALSFPCTPSRLFRSGTRNDGRRTASRMQNETRVTPHYTQGNSLHLTAGISLGVSLGFPHIVGRLRAAALGTVLFSITIIIDDS